MHDVIGIGSYLALFFTELSIIMALVMALVFFVKIEIFKRKVLIDFKKENLVTSPKTNLKVMPLDMLKKYNYLTVKTNFFILILLSFVFITFFFLNSNNLSIAVIFSGLAFLSTPPIPSKWRYIIKLINEDILVVEKRKEYYLYTFKDNIEKETILSLHKKVLLLTFFIVIFSILAVSLGALTKIV